MMLLGDLTLEIPGIKGEAAEGLDGANYLYPSFLQTNMMVTYDVFGHFCIFICICRGRPGIG
jgi:hypothetical protein